MFKYYSSSWDPNVITHCLEAGISNLLSYWNRKDAVSGVDPYILKILESSNIPEGFDFRFMLDSGVFTARKHGKMVEVDDLCDYYHRNKDYYNVVMTVDQGRYSQWLENTARMKANGVPVAGIIRPDMSASLIQEITEASDNYISISSLGLPMLTKEGREDFIKIYKTIRNLIPEETKIHILGCSRHDLIIRCFPDSVDASSLAQYTAFGNKLRIDPVRGIQCQPTERRESGVDRCPLGFTTRIKYNTRVIKAYENYVNAVHARRVERMGGGGR